MTDIQQALERALPAIAIRFQSELTLIAPVDTGRLKGSIKVMPTNNGLEITMVDYAKFVEFGTPPHVIIPKSKKALKFKIGNKVLLRKKVKHPGTRPNPFIRNTIQNKLKKIISEELSRDLNTNI